MPTTLSTPQEVADYVAANPVTNATGSGQWVPRWSTDFLANFLSGHDADNVFHPGALVAANGGPAGGGATIDPSLIPKFDPSAVDAVLAGGGTAPDQFGTPGSAAVVGKPGMGMNYTDNPGNPADPNGPWTERDQAIDDYLRTLPGTPTGPLAAGPTLAHALLTAASVALPAASAGLAPLLAGALGISNQAAAALVAAAGGAAGGGANGGGLGALIGGVTGGLGSLGGSYLGSLLGGGVGTAAGDAAGSAAGSAAGATGSAVGGGLGNLVSELVVPGISGLGSAALGATAGGLLGSAAGSGLAGAGSHPSTPSPNEVSPLTVTGAPPLNPGGALGGVLGAGVGSTLTGTGGPSTTTTATPDSGQTEEPDQDPKGPSLTDTLTNLGVNTGVSLLGTLLGHPGSPSVGGGEPASSTPGTSPGASTPAPGPGTSPGGGVTPPDAATPGAPGVANLGGGGGGGGLVGGGGALSSLLNTGVGAPGGPGGAAADINLQSSLAPDVFPWRTPRVARR